MGPDHVVYALKFVDFTGQSEHAIASFKQEHEVLKSLQGKPHVIQMIASQVRLQLALPQLDILALTGRVCRKLHCVSMLDTL